MNQIAQCSGLSQSMISLVEHNLRNPTLDTLLRICDALGIDFETVLRRAKAEAGKR
jgi:transcriptional regulator with XRE-family HTH domain